ncbi:hypothetical protein [Achromobacter pulmonis]|uniref:hypothetical protein n=1 Tax=Achromobacter pulmonis TaxID=1389932 RepID=UPI001F30D8FD|nr:hypothetical protein [Achromobacter pulmonis]MCF7770188.1 hypothetical protein [Achromobacter pulmonis]
MSKFPQARTTIPGRNQSLTTGSFRPETDARKGQIFQHEPKTFEIGGAPQFLFDHHIKRIVLAN